MTELSTSGLAAAFDDAVNVHGRRDAPVTLEGCIKDLGVINVAELQLHAADFGSSGETFDTPAVPAPVFNGAC